jgi:hypothetical protein
MEEVLRDLVGRRVSVRMVDETEAEGTLEGGSGMWLRLRDRKNALICVYLPNICFLEERM